MIIVGKLYDSVLVAQNGEFKLVSGSVLSKKLNGLREDQKVKVAQCFDLCKEYPPHKVLNKDFNISKRCGYPLRDIVHEDTQYIFGEIIINSKSFGNLIAMKITIKSEDGIETNRSLAYLPSVDMLWTFNEDNSNWSIKNLELFLKNPYIFILGVSKWELGDDNLPAYILGGKLDTLDRMKNIQIPSSFIMDFHRAGLLGLKRLNKKTGKLEDWVSVRNSLYTPLGDMERAFEEHYNLRSFDNDYECKVESRGNQYKITCYKDETRLKEKESVIITLGENGFPL